MKINVKKTIVMCISRDRKRKAKICIDGQIVEQVEPFKYPGSLISEAGYCKKDIQSRIEIAKKCFYGQKESVYK